MKPISSKIILSIMLVLALLAISFAGCPNNEETDTTGAPTIPPENTFVIDFSSFTSGNEAASTTIDTGNSIQLADFTLGDGDLYPSGPYALGDKSNWVFACGSVLFWSGVVAVTLVIPVTAFLASFQHNPQQQEDYSWIWPYDVPGTAYSAELHGEFIEDYSGTAGIDGTDSGVRWEMSIFKQGWDEDFQWFYGESALPATDGFWILQKSQSNPVDFLSIYWERSLTDNTYSITYTNIEEGSDQNGGYITHGVTTDEPYNCFFEIYQAVPDKLTTIEWDCDTLEGRVKSEHYDDDEWRGWDADGNNI